jgi:hypothetical protein
MVKPAAGFDLIEQIQETAIRQMKPITELLCHKGVAFTQ